MYDSSHLLYMMSEIEMAIQTAISIKTRSVRAALLRSLESLPMEAAEHYSSTASSAIARFLEASRSYSS